MRYWILKIFEGFRILEFLDTGYWKSLRGWGYWNFLRSPNLPFPHFPTIWRGDWLPQICHAIVLSSVQTVPLFKGSPFSSLTVRASTSSPSVPTVPSLSLPSSPLPHPLPVNSMLTSHLVAGPNSFTLSLAVPSHLNISAWRQHLSNYPDKLVCDFLEFGWPVSYTCTVFCLIHQSSTNHGSSLSNPFVIDKFLSTECSLGRTCGPFISNPLSVDLAISPHWYLWHTIQLYSITP